MRHGGSGPPVLLLHGHPRTHATWHRVAPLLAAGHTVVCPDLRGYGESSKPPTTPDHEPYSKRAMAGDCVALMRALGHERFAVAGHDRGSYVALRLALDHPEAVTRLVVLDVGARSAEALARCDARFARAVVALVLPRPDRQAGRAGDQRRPGRVVRGRPASAWARRPSPTSAGRSTTRTTVHAMCEDYRAGLGIDRVHDDADRAAGRRVTLPDASALVEPRRPRGSLRRPDRRLARTGRTTCAGASIDSGHHIAEEAPAELAEKLRAFLAG